MPNAMSTIASENYACPKCNANPGESCRQPKGRRQWPPHKERVKQLTEAEIASCRGSLIQPPIN